MGSRWTMAGMEVPIIGSDSVRWIELSLPSSSSSSRDTETDTTCRPLIHDFASCSAIGDPPAYLIWRIHKSQPNALELLELCSSKEFPRTGLRITFPDALSPFVFLCKNEVDINCKDHPYLLYALTESGVAYLLRIRNISSYSSSSAFPPDDLHVAFDMRAYGPITSAAVSASGCFVVGRNDGSVGCFQLGTLDPTAPDFVHELRDDSGIGRLWGFMSRGRMVGAVQDMVISKIHGKKLLFVLHSDGVLRVWDLSCYSKLFSHTMNVPTTAGAALVRLWVGAACDSSIIPLAVLCRHTLEISSEIIYLCSLQYSMGDRIALLLDPSIQSIPLGEVGCIDVKLTSDKIWILKDNALVLQTLYSTEVNMEDTCYYALQEEFVADQLFQSPENSSDELLLIAHSIFSSAKFMVVVAKDPLSVVLLLSGVCVMPGTVLEMLGSWRRMVFGIVIFGEWLCYALCRVVREKDHIVRVVSSIFLRRLLQPGVHHSIALRSTFLDYNRHWTDSDFQTLTSDGLKKEILSLIEHEGVAENLMSIHSSWKNFFARYFHNWCKCNAPCGLLVESSAGAVGLIRKNSFSLFRSLEDVERLIYGSSEGLGEPVSFGLDLFDDDLEHEVLIDLLRCVTSISQHLGKTASSIFYESFVSTPVISSEEVVPRILKFLETGYSSSVATLKLSELGTPVAWEKKLMDHKNLRKFSVDMLVSLHALCRKAVTWSKVLSVIEGYLKFLVPQKIVQNLDAEPLLDINASILVQATSQVAKMMFESALDILLFLGYLVNNSGQINISHDDISKIQLELVPMIQETISEWLIVHFFATTPSESAVIEDFSSQLSLLQIDSSSVKRSWNEKLGKCDFPLAFVLLLNIRVLPGDQNHPYSRCLPYLHDIISSMRTFASWIIWGKSGESSTFFSHSTELALILLRHGQYDAVEHLLRMVEAHSQKEKTSESIQDTNGGWCILHHLLGCCLLAQAQRGLHGMLRERKVCEAVRCFFRASSVKDASLALQSLPHEAGSPLLDFSSISGAAWKLHYYQKVMQIFEQYDISEGACVFALAALEQVEEALSTKDENSGRGPFNESATTIKGRLWANVFKFTLDLKHFHDAYCAIISNPDEESKYICLRRFIIVLYECGAMKILCGGHLPFIGLIDKVEQELVWKAERSDILMKPNLYKLLYAFEMHRHNWRRAASYIYQYCDRLRTKAAVRDYQHSSLDLQERLNGLSAAINALHLVHPAYAWIDPLLERHSVQDEHYPFKKARRSVEEESSGNGFQPQKLHSYIDIEQIENEFVLTSAEYLLSLAHVKWRFTGIHKVPSDLVDLLIQTDLYDMAFTVLLKFFKGSDLKRELETVFSAMSLKCCPNKVDSSWAGDDRRNHGFLLTSSKDEVVVHSSPDMGPTTQQSKGISRWGTLELYLEKYRAFHARLPLIVAETLLRTDPQIELPLWLVNMFKDGQRERTWGMTGQESNPALLFRIYVDYGRYTEATNLLLEYIDSYASMRPANIINRKRPFTIWFPYTAIQRLWCQLEELIRLGRMEDQCDKLKRLLHGALLKHLELLKVDSDDAISAAG